MPSIKTNALSNYIMVQSKHVDNTKGSIILYMSAEACKEDKNALGKYPISVCHNLFEKDHLILFLVRIRLLRFQSLIYLRSLREVHFVKGGWIYRALI